jgi:hypothetical protein
MRASHPDNEISTLFPNSFRELVAGEIGLMGIISLHASIDDKIRCFLSQLGRRHYE